MRDDKTFTGEKPIIVIGERPDVVPGQTEGEVPVITIEESADTQVADDTPCRRSFVCRVCVTVRRLADLQILL